MVVNHFLSDILENPKAGLGPESSRTDAVDLGRIDLSLSHIKM